jgi:hypothetical protein
MLSVYDGHHRYGRRDFLKIGSLGLGGMTLADLIAGRQATAAAGQVVRDKAVVFLFMHGGPSQVETFDPKMTAPSGIRSATGEIQTAIPGITYGSTFPKLAAMADRTSIVRSFVTGDGRHDIKPIVGKSTLDGNLGSIYSRIVGQNRSDNGMPTNVLLLPRAVDDKAQPGVTQFGKFDSTGTIGSAFQPFTPSGGGDLKADMKLTLPMGRLNDRRGLLTRLDRLKRSLDDNGRRDGLDRIREQAFSTILGGVGDAFDLSKEDPRTIARYDTRGLQPAAATDSRWNNRKNYADNGNTLGKLMLLARRLVERGCGFITVTTNFVWDMHADVNNADVVTGMNYMGIPFDHAVSAFLEDLRERGLQDKVLLVCCGEMGRTPRINKKGGRDHWGNIAPLMLAGGGLEMGQVIGQSTRDVGEPLTTPCRIENLIGTVFNTLFDVGQVRLNQGLPRDIARAMETYQPIPGLL